MSSTAALPTAGVLRYGVLGLPLAFAALPIYVHVPALYANELGLSLSLVGAILLATRIADAIADPLIGWASDR
ncbi:MFS transporter, partial [Zoogloea sp.]|uniref:MFS transporter n=1 Tax=Zoogloea sp. TaxID=49181 RepID=UPI0025848761